MLHPVRVAVVADSDTVVVADDISNVVAATTFDGAKPTIYQHYNWAKITAGMSVAVTRDKHVIFGNDGTPGIYRFAGEEHAAAGKSLLPTFGGVAADPKSSRWAAAQDPNYIYIFDGQDMLKKTRLPPNKSLYRNGLLSFSPAGAVCVALRDSDKTTGPVSLSAYNIEKDRWQSIFSWDTGEMTDFVVGPWQPWNGSTSGGSQSF